MIRNYEIMYIINPVTTEEQKAEVIEKVNAILAAAKAEDVKVEKWGERKLAYPIDKKETGFYVLTTFKIEGTELKEVETKLNITENLMRYIVVKKD
ncbi:SSU ribosomal protein S6P [Hypnocyclicus thermotrophus]|uniref:Small ribosomal subunit protein bS6 n=1 Tax=Hypnocyclicus thermotrophus TaxID=1627895 RepID=A0AA46DYC8_9FUSO|nr:SSU ribosomal protein S6P [Hypnocyclicus thermotrophus]